MTRSGAAASSLPQCKYFHQMKFLHEKTANHPTESNISHAAQQVTVPPPADACEPANQMPCNSATKRKASELPCPPSSRHKSRQDAIDMAILKQLETTDNTLNKSLGKQETDDEVSHYCKSLIPIIGGLEVKKKRLAMIKISQLLFDIEFEE